LFAIGKRKKFLITTSAKGTLHPTTTRRIPRVSTKAPRKSNLPRLRKSLQNQELVLKATMLSPKKEMLDLSKKTK
jgi:hypothetical protein